MNTRHKPENLLKTVSRTVSENQLLEKGDSVLACVSGGADSVALLYALLSLREKYALRLGIAHLNHALRGEDSDGDCAFAKSLAEKSGLPFFSQKADVMGFMKSNRLSLEDAARQVRYSFFRETAEKEGFDKIATGHHADDNAELVLMNLLRGSGPQGLAGMSPGGETRIIRPLLEVTRADIEAFIQSRNLSFRTDQSNFDPNFRRNRIRLELIPSLARHYNPNISKSLNRTASIIRSDEEWLEEVTDSLYRDLVFSKEPDRIRFQAHQLAGIHRAARRRVFRKAIGELKGDLKKVTLCHVDSAVAMIDDQRGFSLLDLPDRIRVVKNQGLIAIQKEESELRALSRKKITERIPSFSYRVPSPSDAPKTVLINETGLKLHFSQLPAKGREKVKPASPATAYLDMDKLVFPLSIRNTIPGDRFTPLGMGGTQKLKKYFINNKVPREERAATPVLLSKNKIIWVAGHRIDNGFKITESTEKVLKVELFLA